MHLTKHRRWGVLHVGRSLLQEAGVGTTSARSTWGSAWALLADGLPAYSRRPWEVVGLQQSLITNNISSVGAVWAAAVTSSLAGGAVMTFSKALRLVAAVIMIMIPGNLPLPLLGGRGSLPLMRRPTRHCFVNGLPRFWQRPTQLCICRTTRSGTQVYLDKQPRFARPLVAMYCAYDVWAVPLQDAPLDALLQMYPKGARIIRRKLVQLGLVRVCVVSGYHALRSQLHKLDAFEVVTCGSPENTCRGHETIEKDEDQFNVVGLIHSNSAICADRAELLMVAIPKEPDDFVRDAVKAGHPRNLLAESRKGVAKEVAKNIVMSKDERDKVAKPCLERWAATKKATERAGQELMSKAPEYIQRASNGKNVLLWKAILEECDFPDEDLWQALHQGFRITGWMPDTGLFVKNVRPPVMSIDELLSQSRYRTPATLRSIENAEADEAAFGAWKETLSELEAGWLFIDENPNPVEIIVARRFGLQQKNKLRVIDDGKMCGLNLTCGLPERFTLHGVDVIAGALLEALALAEDGGVALRGITYDLVSAYKFYPLHPDDCAKVANSCEGRGVGRSRRLWLQRLGVRCHWLSGGLPTHLCCDLEGRSCWGSRTLDGLL
ncbi:unnamed protein product [Symbiodinium natans]|uniref:Uncharacterized protein n=1 Tax=Symbiodinium natans TaxID=878477 RepID=A0A812UNU0_9DINO|nr:unnamed protein product [Symbiodinium natans]